MPTKIEPMFLAEGKRLVLLRAAQRPPLEAKDVALKIGVSSAAVSSWETGKGKPGTANMAALDAVYGGTGAVFEIYGLTPQGQPSNAELLAKIEALTVLCQNTGAVVEQLASLVRGQASPTARPAPARLKSKS